MTDLEMIKKCAEKMGVADEVFDDKFSRKPNYDPLHDDAQAMALVKKFRITISNQYGDKWACFQGHYSCWTVNPDLNRAIVECVAKM